MLPLIVDAHEDIAYNILNFGGITPALPQKRAASNGKAVPPPPSSTGRHCWAGPITRRGRVAVVFSTLFVTPIRRKFGTWENQVYADYNQAHRLYRIQLDAYHKLGDEAPRTIPGHCFPGGS